MLDTGYWSKIPFERGCWIEDAGCRMQDGGYLIPIEFLTSTAGQPVTRNSQPGEKPIVLVRQLLESA